MQRAFRERHDDEDIKNSVDTFGEFSIQKILKHNKIELDGLKYKEKE